MRLPHFYGSIEISYSYCACCCCSVCDLLSISVTWCHLGTWQWSCPFVIFLFMHTVYKMFCGTCWFINEFSWVLMLCFSDMWHCRNVSVFYWKDMLCPGERILYDRFPFLLFSWLSFSYCISDNILVKHRLVYSPTHKFVFLALYRRNN